MKGIGILKGRSSSGNLGSSVGKLQYPTRIQQGTRIHTVLHPDYRRKAGKIKGCRSSSCKNWSRLHISGGTFCRNHWNSERNKHQDMLGRIVHYTGTFGCLLKTCKRCRWSLRCRKRKEICKIGTYK